jgi:ankyrin repeat domain-containing protein 13
MMVKKLRKIPDFYMELKWKFNSSLIPLVSTFAPKDTFRIWKIGSSLRLDFTLVGINRLSAKRREMSIIFRNGAKAKDRYRNCYLLLVNRTKGIVVDPLEDLDYEEKIAILQDILNSDSIKAEVQVSEPKIKQCTTLFGNPKTSKVGSLSCAEYKMEFESTRAIEK